MGGVRRWGRRTLLKIIRRIFIIINTMCINSKKYQLSKKPTFWGLLFLLIIIVFAIIYRFLPSEFWNNTKVITNYWDALYFSIVTITTLGFGDVFPASCAAKTLTCAEVILGVITIGLFLNAISTEQAKKVDNQSKERQDAERKKSAISKIARHFPLVIPKIQSFLLECFEVVTPLDKRDFPDNLLAHKFDWQFKDLKDLYSTTLCLLNPYSSKVIENYFRTEHELYDELKYLNSNTELQIYPELQNLVFEVLNECSSFTFEPAILSAMNVFSQDEKRKPLSDGIKEMIESYDGDLKFSESNILNGYIALHKHLEIMIPKVQRIGKMMESILTDIK